MDALDFPTVKLVVVGTSDPATMRTAKSIRDDIRWPRPNQRGTRLEVLGVDNFACGPRKQLERLCRFLGLELDAEYLDRATTLVLPKYCNRTGGRSQSDRLKDAKKKLQAFWGDQHE